MPRKKKVQPAPLEVIKAGDIEIEIRDAATRIIGRGEDKKFLTAETINQIVLVTCPGIFRPSEIRDNGSLTARSSDEESTIYGRTDRSHIARS